jgi:hypothetical protein
MAELEWWRRMRTIQLSHFSALGELMDCAPPSVTARDERAFFREFHHLVPRIVDHLREYAGRT